MLTVVIGKFLIVVHYICMIHVRNKKIHLFTHVAVDSIAVDVYPF